jgi:hypothetical protein
MKREKQEKNSREKKKIRVVVSEKGNGQMLYERKRRDTKREAESEYREKNGSRKERQNQSREERGGSERRRPGEESEDMKIE